VEQKEFCKLVSAKSISIYAKGTGDIVSELPSFISTKRLQNFSSNLVLQNREALLTELLITKDRTEEALIVSAIDGTDLEKMKIRQLIHLFRSVVPAVFGIL
jgi:hypothetical protein